MNKFDTKKNEVISTDINCISCIPQQIFPIIPVEELWDEQMRPSDMHHSEMHPKFSLHNCWLNGCQNLKLKWLCLARLGSWLWYWLMALDGSFILHLILNLILICLNISLFWWKGWMKPPRLWRTSMASFRSGRKLPSSSMDSATSWSSQAWHRRPWRLLNLVNQATVSNIHKHQQTNNTIQYLKSSECYYWIYLSSRFSTSKFHNVPPLPKRCAAALPTFFLRRAAAQHLAAPSSRVETTREASNCELLAVRSI